MTMKHSRLTLCTAVQFLTQTLNLCACVAGKSNVWISLVNVLNFFEAIQSNSRISISRHVVGPKVDQNYHPSFFSEQYVKVIGFLLFFDFFRENYYSPSSLYIILSDY